MEKYYGRTSYIKQERAVRKSPLFYAKYTLPLSIDVFVSY
jgi:hypothetical protein